MGIGLAVARAFARRGAHLLLFARREEALKKAVDEVRSCVRSAGQRIGYRTMDVGNHEEVCRIAAGAAEGFGPPDVLINNAGIGYPRYFEDIPYAQFDATIKTNLYGTWNMISALLPFMKERGGYIVNVSSIIGFLGVFGYADYAASKFAVMGLSEVLQSELKRYGISLSVLCPPDTDTPGFKDENLTKPPETWALSENAKVLTADQVAEALLRGMRKRQYLIIPGLEGRFILWAKRFIPSLVNFVMDRQIRGAAHHTDK